ncbi:MAG: hypothetical protein ABDH63_00485 [Candidatus Caldarchaeales archaeon]
MPSKITVGLVLSVLGLGVALAPTLIYLLALGTPIGDALAVEVIPSVPVYLILSMAGVPPSLVGAYTFRKGVRELVASQVLESRLAEAERAAPPTGAVQGASAPAVGPQRSRRAAAGRASAPSPSAESVPAVRQSNPGPQISVTPATRQFSVKTRSEWKVCPQCGQSAELEADSCGYCGYGFPRSHVESCPVCGAPLSYARRISGNLYACGICFSELVKVAS